MSLKKYATPIDDLGEFENNTLYIKREDMIPYSFGGNKARKAFEFFREIDAGDYDCVVTYGSSCSNHCRVVSNMAAGRGLECYIISPIEDRKETFNSRFMEMFGAHITVCPVENVHDTIENKLEALKSEGKKPFFIPGGGHGNIGTKAYVDCYNEIKQYERSSDIRFDYIFLATGTGTTQAGLVSAQIEKGDDISVIGVSIARKNPYCKDVIVSSIKDYLGEAADSKARELTVVVDDYTGEGYAKSTGHIDKIIDDILINYGIPLDPVYTGKAFYGMTEYIKKSNIKDKKILFIHTGGLPLFFDKIKTDLS